MARGIAYALLLHLLGTSIAEDLGVGLPQQWLRSSGPIARHRPGGSASFTVVDAHASEACCQHTLSTGDEEPALRRTRLARTKAERDETPAV